MSQPPAHEPSSDLALPVLPEWFERPSAPEGGAGLRFACTLCGNCCSGPSGYVLVTDDECAALAAHLGLPLAEFLDTHTHVMAKGRSLRERPGAHGLDCVFLDRQSLPGKAVCSVYHHRPAQCRTWPFWKSNLRSADTWALASRVCPGMNKGVLVPSAQVKAQRDVVDI